MDGFVRGLLREVTVSPTVRAAAWAIFTMALVVSPYQWTGGSLAATASTGFALQVRPRVCITLESDSNCPMLLSVAWSGPVAADVCLKLADDDAMLHCWQQQRTGEFELELVRTRNAVVQLLDTSSNRILDEAEVTIVSRDLRESRRRRRHVWSLL